MRALIRRLGVPKKYTERSEGLFGVRLLGRLAPSPSPLPQRGEGFRLHFTLLLGAALLLSGQVLQAADDKIEGEKREVVRVFPRDPFTPSQRMIALGVENAVLELAEVESRSPATQERETLEKLELKGVLLGDKGRVAFINNAVVSAGEEIEGFTVEAITSTSVVLSSGGKEFVLKLKPKVEKIEEESSQDEKTE